MSSIPNTPGSGNSSIVKPGGLLAILGGGQLGRMMAMAARTMGYRIRVMDPEPACPASFVADETIVGRWDDVEAAQRLARGAGAVTLEIEQIGVDALTEVARIAPLRPGVEPIRIIQDKTLQKPWLAESGFPVGPFRVVRNEAELHEAVAALDGRVFLKIGRGGYDGRGQARIGLDEPSTESTLAAAWTNLGGRPAIPPVKCARILPHAIIMRIRSWHGVCCPQACRAKSKRVRSSWQRASLQSSASRDCCALNFS